MLFVNELVVRGLIILIVACRHLVAFRGFCSRIHYFAPSRVSVGCVVKNGKLTQEDRWWWSGLTRLERERPGCELKEVYDLVSSLYPGRFHQLFLALSSLIDIKEVFTR